MDTRIHMTIRTPDNAAITEFKPDWRVHPGETLAEVLAERGITQTYLAWAAGYTLKHVNRVIKGHNSITATMAVRLEDVLGEPDAEFWLRYQMACDLHAAREAERARITASFVP